MLNFPIRRKIPVMMNSMPHRYHVDFTNGLDTNDGLSEGKPWKTITKVNATTLLPGDRVLFKRGETWTGVTLVVPSSGNNLKHIYFGAYGSGANPIVDGNDAVDCINGNGQDYLTFENIDSTQGLDFGFAFDGCVGISVINCNGHDCGNDNLIFSNSSSCTVYGGTYYNGYTRVEDDRFVSGIEIKDGAHDITIYNAEIYANAGKASPAHYAAGIAIHAHAGGIVPYNIVMNGCNIHDGGVNCFGIRVGNMEDSTMTDRNIVIMHNTITANAYGGIQINASVGVSYPVNGVVVKYNRILLNTTRYGLEIVNSTNVMVHHNEITSNNNVQAGQDLGILNSTNVSILNTTFYTNYDNFWFPLTIAGASCSAVIVKNNIFGGTVASLCNIYVAAETGIVGMVIDYNLYQYAGTGNRWSWLGTAMSYTTWKTNNSNDANSPARGDPLFVSVPSDMTLQALSPAINAGVDVGFPYSGIAPDCGAYEKA